MMLGANLRSGSSSCANEHLIQLGWIFLEKWQIHPITTINTINSIIILFILSIILINTINTVNTINSINKTTVTTVSRPATINPRQASRCQLDEKIAVGWIHSFVSRMPTKTLCYIYYLLLIK